MSRRHAPKSNRLARHGSALLGAVSDNGPVSQLGVKALDHIHNKLKALAQETRFKPEERQFLTDQWRNSRRDRRRDQGA